MSKPSTQLSALVVLVLVAPVGLGLVIPGADLGNDTAVLAFGLDAQLPGPNGPLAPEAPNLVPPGPGPSDPYVNIDGDIMRGELDMGDYEIKFKDGKILFANGALEGSAPGPGLRFGGSQVCTLAALFCRGPTGPAGPAGPEGPAGLVNDVDCSPGGFIRSVASGTATCATDADTTYTAGAGLSLTGTTFASTGDTNAADDVLTTTVHGGDVTGVYSDLQIASGAIALADIGQNACTTNQIMKWSGTAWTCAADADADTLGALACTNGQIPKRSGGLWGCGFDADTDTLAALSCTSGQVPKWDDSSSSSWTCAADANTIYSAGAGIDITSTTISNIGDTDATNDVLTTTVHGGDVTGVYSNLQLGPDSVGAPEIQTGAVGTGEIADGAILFQDIASNGCAVGQFVKWDGAAWVCATVSDTGTVTQVDTGAGLTGGPITTTGTLSIATGGVTSAMILDGTVAVADLAFDPATQADLDGAVGRPVFARTTLDSAGTVGEFTSVAIGSDGLGLISYWDGVTGNHDLKVAHCDNVACSTATTAMLDGSTTSVGEYTSVTIGSDGLGLISYYSQTNQNLKVAHCSDTACRTATTAVLDSAGDAGWYTSVTVGSDGLGLISYYDITNRDLKVAHCDNTACGTATTATLDSTGDVGKRTSVTVGSDGLGLISYWDETNRDLKVAHCSNTACGTATNATLDSTGDVGWYNSVTVGSDGLGLISYRDNTNADLKVAHCSNTACSAATLATLDSAGDVGWDSSVTIGSDGLGLISYFDNTAGDLKVAHCSNTACSAATLATLDSTGTVGRYSSVTVGSDGLGLITYWDITNFDLKVVHLSNRLGVPFHRPR